MKKIVRVIAALHSFVFCGYGMDDPPFAEHRATAKFSLSVMAYFDTYRHRTRGILVCKLDQEECDEDDYSKHSPPPCNPEIPDQLIELSKRLDEQTKTCFEQYLLETLPTDHFLIQVGEHTLTNSLIEKMNSSPAQFVILVTTDKKSNLNRFIKISEKLDPRIKIALSDRTHKGISFSDIERLLAKSKDFNLYYLALRKLNDDVAHKISECENLQSLVGLSVEKSRLTEKGLLNFAESTMLPNLKVFSTDIRSLLTVRQTDFFERLALFQARLMRYEWVGSI
ncbi:MAG: hypothetical protein V4482_06175 [Pseudomonadota bacterium]